MRLSEVLYIKYGPASGWVGPNDSREDHVRRMHEALLFCGLKDSDAHGGFPGYAPNGEEMEEGVEKMNMKVRPSLRLMAKEDGVWLEATAANGNHCMVNLSLPPHGPVVQGVLEEMALAAGNPRKASPEEEFLAKRFPGVSRDDPAFTFRDVELALKDYMAGLAQEGGKVCKMAAKVILTGETICSEDGEDCTGIEGACDDDKN